MKALSFRRRRLMVLVQSPQERMVNCKFGTIDGVEEMVKGCSSLATRGEVKETKANCPGI